MLRALLFILLVLPALSVQASLDLDRWDALLAQAVSDGQVDYRQWRENPDFDALVSQVGDTDTSGMSRQARLAFLINAYNILAAEGILAGSSPSSWLGRLGYFRRDSYLVAGREMSLHELEHEVMRPLGEARIHFAIVCASESCPVLRAEAYRPASLDAQLDDAASNFINDPRRNRFDAAAREAEISPIFDWFAEDFEAEAGGVQPYIAPYVEEPAVAALLREGIMALDYADYSWELNGVK